MEDLKQAVNLFKETLSVEDVDIPMIPTGIDIYDIFSGGGLPLGEFVLVIGDPGAGKTTIYLQLLGLVQQRLNSIALIFDAERSINANRKATLGLIPELTIHKQVGITLEKLNADLAELIKVKIKNKIETPILTLWDSIATTPVESSSQDVSHEALVKAKLLPKFFRDVHEHLIENKITLIGINHITDKVKMSMYEKDDSIIPGLRGKNIPGGRYQVFAAYQLPHISRITDIDPAIYGFKGYIAEIIFRKNKAAIPLQPFRVIVDYIKGIDNFWTNFYYLKEAQLIKVAGGWLSLNGYEGKFRQKEAKDKYQNDENFKEAFDSNMNTLKAALRESVGSGAAMISDISEEELERANGPETTVKEGS